MITKIRLHNFKGFRHFELSDLSKVTLIGGRNNVGKTSLLEAIFLFYDTHDAGLFFRYLGWRGIQVFTADAETLFAPSFYDFDMGQPLTIEIWDSIYQSKLDVRFNPSITHQSINVDLSVAGKSASPLPQVSTSYSLDLHYQVTGGSGEHIGLAVKQSLTNLSIQFEPGPTTVFPEEMRRMVICLPLRFKPDPQEDVIRYGKLDIERKTARIIEFLQVLEPHLVDLSSIVQPSRPDMYADITGMARKIPVPLLGDGISRLFSIILAIASCPNGIVLIDEIDAGLHHSILPKIWQGIFQAAQEFQCQIIATTHSYECLQAAYEGAQAAQAQRDFCYIRLEQQEENIIGKTYSYDVLGAALAQGWEVR